MIIHLFIFIFVSFYHITLEVSQHECEKKAPNSFNEKQKTLLCSSTNPSNIGPSLCATLAKDKLHLDVKDIINICQGASSIDPVYCYRELLPSYRKNYGSELCKGYHRSHEILPSACFNYLIELKGANSVKPNNAAVFCKSSEFEGIYNCVKTCIKEKLTDSNKAMKLCESATTNATVDCLMDMKLFSNSIHSVSQSEIVEFCASANPSAYTLQQQNDYRNNISEITHSSKFLSPLANCFNVSKDIHSSATSTVPYLTGKQRLEICKNAPTINHGLGPINCTIMLLYKSNDIKISVKDVISLCSTAINYGPATCFLESKGLGTNDKRIEICQGASNSVSIYYLYSLKYSRIDLYI